MPFSLIIPLNTPFALGDNPVKIKISHISFIKYLTTRSFPELYVLLDSNFLFSYSFIVFFYRFFLLDRLVPLIFF